MPTPTLSTQFATRQPSAIRSAQIKFAKRNDNTKAINTAIGNVSLPMHPAMQERMFHLSSDNSPFKDGVVKYTSTVGVEETNNAFLNIISASGFDTSGLYSQITDGGSQSMELVILGTCGPAGSSEKPLLLLDAAYTNYASMAKRLGRRTVSVTRNLSDDGTFSMPDFDEIEEVIVKEKPGALLIIPFDNPTGQFMDMEMITKLAELCVKHNIWMISDEAYRELNYTDSPTSSIWGLTEETVPDITGRRISIESASKVWNACGLRIGATITDNQEYHSKSVAENTANLCSSAIGQYIFGSLAHENHDDLNTWFEKQREYYRSMLFALTTDLKNKLPGIIVSNPDAAIYSVVDVRNISPEGFDAADFVDYCATQGSVDIDGENLTLLVSPMAGFYSVAEEKENPGKTQMRIAYVESPENMKKVPCLFVALFEEYLKNN